MNLIEKITSKKAELASIIVQLASATDRKAFLENEIADLEYRLTKVKLNNPHACLDVTQMADKGGCVGCNFEDGCIYRGKYKKFKL